MSISKPRGGRPRTTTLRNPSTSSVPTSPVAPPAVDSASSLPPMPRPETLAVPTFRKLPDDSKVRIKAMQILALRAAGLEESEIATQLGLSKGTIRNYIYLAGSNGWLDAESLLGLSPVERIESMLLSKVVATLDKAVNDELNSPALTPIPVATRLFDATLAKHWAPVVSTGPQQTLVAIRIETPPGTPQAMREGTVRGIGAWVEGEESAN